MTFLSDLFDEAELQHALTERLVVARQHPVAPLTILNYTERCQYEKGLWSPVTLTCRGLIHDSQGKILARPFRKFFNYGEPAAPVLDFNEPVTAYDKVDGSLGVLFPLNGGYAVATRGSFDSDQARHATEVFNTRYAGFVPPDGWTFLFEIIYPENRIVLDYGDMDDLVLLGAVEIATGKSVGAHDMITEEWPGPRADEFFYKTLAEALEAPARPNAEGLVIHFLETDERLKIKQEDYMALHKIISGLNERAVWEHLKDGKPMGELLANLPDEFHSWVIEVSDRLLNSVALGAAEVESVYGALVDGLPVGYSRKDFAITAKDLPLKSLLFARHDNKNYRPMLWDACYPSGRVGPRGVSSDDGAADE